MNIAIVLYDKLTALDAIGPYEVLSRLPGATLQFVAAEPGPVRTDNGMLTLLAEHSLADAAQPDIVLVPGGPGEVAARIAGDTVAQAIQLGIEYDPQPPYDAGSPDRAPAQVVASLRARSRFILTGRRS